MMHKLLDEVYYTSKLPNGLDVISYPKKGLKGLLISISVHFGSGFDKVLIEESKEIINIPAGAAHFLEHMVFYNELGNSYMKKLSYLNAKVNGATSPDRTVYSLETCEKDFSKAFKCFLDMVFNVGFTYKNLNAERSVIKQEKIENDTSRIMYASLENAYISEGIRDVVGDVYSISREDLLLYYKLFYHPENMLITVVGDFDDNLFNSVLEEFFKTKSFDDFKRFKFLSSDVPSNMRKRNIIDDRNLDVQTSMLLRMHPDKLYGRYSNKVHIQLCIEFLSSYLFNKLSEIYDFDDSCYDSTYVANDSFAFWLITYKTSNHEYSKFFDKIFETLRELGKKEILERDFLTVKKTIYACVLSGFDSYEDITDCLIEFYFYGISFEDYLDGIIKFSRKEFLETLEAVRKTSMILTTVLSE